MDCRLYLRASTQDQDASRARADLEAFAKEHGLKIVGRYTENESGAKLHRPQLFKLIEDSNPDDILLVEHVDRLSRLTAADWKKLREMIHTKQVRVVALDLPTSHRMTASSDDFTGRMLEAVNGMMLDMLAAVARKDYEDRRRRVAQGQAKAKADGRYRGRGEDTKRNALIGSMLEKNMSWSQIMEATGVARGTVAKIAKRIREAAAE
ncbi:recombinase family protein [Rhizobium sp.]|uniref:recombinase family protein n=1 Tax=Rhizobium sp. TaxID=391 RepID=UPI0028A83E74